MTATIDPGVLLSASGITKLFGEFAANDGVALEIRSGERHALLGENGAGKSTLVKMMYGVLQPTAGEFSWKGQPTIIPSPAAARELGIGMVFQHFSVFESLNVTENIALALPPEPIKDLSGRIAAVSERYGLALDPTRPVHTLSVGEKQRVEIVRCLLQSPELLIMDEPTSVLTPQETEVLFETLRRLSSDGCAILYITHKLSEVVELCDTATILRHGKLIATCTPRNETPQSMAEMMVGSEIQGVDRPPAEISQSRLQINNLSLRSASETGVSLREISLDVHGGEIVGIAGIAGEGQTELMSALIGEDIADPEAIRIDDLAVGGMRPTGRRANGAAFVPEERAGHAAVPAMSLSENIVLSHRGEPGIATAGWINWRKAKDWVGRVRESFDVRSASDDPVASALSGGNLQKFVVGREILRSPGVLVVNQPTWGVDAGAASLIRRELIALARKGAAVLVISQDLEEVFTISDRIAVMYRGSLSRPYAAEVLTPEMAGLLMTGGSIPEQTTEAVT